MACRFQRLSFSGVCSPYEITLTVLLVTQHLFRELPPCETNPWQVEHAFASENSDVKLAVFSKIDWPKTMSRQYRTFNCWFPDTNEFLRDAWICESCTIGTFLDCVRALGYLRHDCRDSAVAVVHRSQMLAKESPMSNIDMASGEALLVLCQDSVVDDRSVATLVRKGFSVASAVVTLRYTANCFDEAEEVISGDLHPRGIRERLLRDGRALGGIVKCMGCYDRQSTERFLGSLLLNPSCFERELESIRFDPYAQSQYNRGPLFYTFVQLLQTYNELIGDRGVRCFNEQELAIVNHHYAVGENILRGLCDSKKVSVAAHEFRICCDFGLWPSFIAYAWCLEFDNDPRDSSEIRRYLNRAAAAVESSSEYEYAQHLYSHLRKKHSEHRSRYPTFGSSPSEATKHVKYWDDVSRGIPSEINQEVMASPFVQNAAGNGIDWAQEVIDNLQNRGSVPEYLAESGYRAAIDRITNHANRKATGIHEVNETQDPQAVLDASLFRASVAERNDEFGLYFYGMCWYLGYGVQRNYVRAARYLRMSAEFGSERGQFSYGMRCFSGEGVARDFEQAARYFKMSADQGYDIAQFHYGRCLYYGNGVSQNLEEAARYFKMCADQGNEYGQIGYGHLLFSGEGIRQNFEEAARYLKMSADQGNRYGQYDYGVCLLNGKGVSQNFEEAARYFKMSADQGDASGQNQYGVCLLEGNGVSQNFAAAPLEW